jgi:purine-cytosine permease-like protein
MMQAVNLGAWGAVLMTVATLTTNFVNIYMSALALRSLMPRVGALTCVWTTGLIGAALSLFSGGWLDRYASFMLVLGGILVPVGGVLLARFFIVGDPGSDAAPPLGDARGAVKPHHVEDFYDPRGPYSGHGGFDLAGLGAWLAGGVTYYAAGSIGATLPALVVAVVVYSVLRRALLTDN